MISMYFCNLLITLSGLQGKYVDVMKDSVKPSSSIPANLFSVLPESYSVPDNIFMPSGKSAMSP